MKPLTNEEFAKLKVKDAAVNKEVAVLVKGFIFLALSFSPALIPATAFVTCV